MRRWVLVLLCSWAAAVRLEAAEFTCAGYASVVLPAAAAAKPLASSSRALQEQQQVRALVIFARFTDDDPADQTAPGFAAALFDPEREGSLAHFYHAMSSGQFELRGTVLPRRYVSRQPASAYVSSEPARPGKYSQFALEVLQQADADVDFSQFDDDGPDGVPNSGDDDGVVDYLFIDVLSAPRGLIIGGATGIAGLGLDEAYACADRGRNGAAVTISGTRDHGAFLQEGTFSQTVGAMAHEFGHGLGLPDLYDMVYGDPAEDSGGVGRWDLMGWGAHGWTGDDGPNPFSAWSLKQLGWIGRRDDRRVEVPGDTTDLEVASLYQGGAVYQLPLPRRFQDGQEVGQEYLLLEQRTRSDSYYDRHLPGEGLLVWHVRSYSGNENDETVKMVDLVCADGLYQDAGYPLGRQPASQGGDNLDFWAHDEVYAQAHGGNLGDATDPFDGVRFTRFDRESNPSIDLQGLLAEASTGPALHLRRQGEQMVVGVERLGWAGTIRQEVHWAGQVLVDGDLVVAPEGRLVIHPGTQVRFAGTDRLRAGRDPGHSELDIQGGFVIREDYLSPLLFPGGQAAKSKVVFAALHPGDNWYGIVMEPAQPGRVEVPEDSYELQDAVQGILLPGSPPDSRGQVLKRVGLVDGLGRTRTGDKSFSPGETFQCRLEVGNWSLTAYAQVQAEVRWTTPLVYSQFTPQVEQVHSAPAGLYPGDQLVLELPSLTLSPQARPGEVVELAVSLNNKATRTPQPIGQEERISLTVAEPHPLRQVHWTVPGHELRGESVQIEPDQATPVQVRFPGRALAANLVLQSIPGLHLVAEIAMLRRPDQAGEQVFETLVQPPGPGLYQARLRLHGQGTSVPSSPASLYVWAAHAEGDHPALVFLGDAYTQEERAVLGQVLRARLVELGMSPYILETAPGEGLFYQALLAQYEVAGGLVVWAGTALDADAQAAFRLFLDRGGRLLMASSALSSSGDVELFMRQVVRAFPAARLANTQVRSAGFLAGPGLQFRVPHTSLDLTAPALPILQDGRGRAAGVYLDMDTYRLVYLGFDLKGLEQPQLETLVASVLALVQAEEQPVLEVPGLVGADHVALAPPAQPLAVRARVPGNIQAVDLVVSSLPYQGVESQTRLAATRTQEFSGTFPLSAVGQRLLWLRLHRGDGQTYVGGQSLLVWPVPVPQGSPVLVFMHQSYAPADREKMRTDLGTALQRLGLQADFVDLAPADGSLYTVLLPPYEEVGKAVVWLGQSLDLGAQAVFRDFLGQGGRLLMFSPRLQRSANGSAFLQDLFHTSLSAGTWKIGGFHQTGAAVGPDYTLRYFPLSLEPPTVPALVDEEGGIAGIQLDQGTYRAAYFAFDLKDVERSARRELLADKLLFLCQLPASPERPVPQSDREVAGGEPLSFQAGPNYPNPFNAQTAISYSLPFSAQVQLTLYNSMGQVVRRLVDQAQSPGRYEVIWDGRDGEGRAAGTGVYFYRLEAGSLQQTRRLVLLK